MHVNISPLIVTMVAEANVNVAMLLALSPKVVRSSVRIQLLDLMHAPFCLQLAQALEPIRSAISRMPSP